MDFWTVVIMFIILWVGIAVGMAGVASMRAANTSNKKKAMEDHLALIDDFSATQKVMGSDGNTWTSHRGTEKESLPYRPSSAELKTHILSN